ncbi:MAG TPA: tetratricopeptide repeat protein [Oculatellaceae cyanobacterium]
MRIFSLVAALTIVASAICLPPVQAMDADSHEFPGKGSRAAWEEANGYYIQAVRATQTNKVDESIALYKRAIAIYPDDPDFQINLGVALEDKGNLKEAEAALNHAMTLAPQNWTVPYNLGNVMYLQHKYQDSVNFWSKALTMNPTEHFKQRIQQNITQVTKQYLKKK